MIHLDHIRWRLKQLLVNPKRAIVGRFKLAQKVGNLGADIGRLIEPLTNRCTCRPGLPIFEFSLRVSIRSALR